jgi:hypothetical protein
VPEWACGSKLLGLNGLRVMAWLPLWVAIGPGSGQDVCGGGDKVGGGGTYESGAFE